ncbi:hypothetical protein SNE40_010165 [Patella caerulea]|uniref:Uncharacterized protein n=1 Tax=Patella caerulea TaxID=87958 RepID=A0AAN8JUP6_PATCE
MLKLVVVCAVIAFVAAQTDVPTTRHGHHSHVPHSRATHPTDVPHSSKAPHNFHYFHDTILNKLVIRTSTECFVFSLTDAQQMAVNTPTGLRATEVALVAMIGTATQTAIQLSDLSKHAAKHCQNHQSFAVTQ